MFGFAIYVRCLVFTKFLFCCVCCGLDFGVCVFGGFGFDGLVLFVLVLVLAILICVV